MSDTVVKILNEKPRKTTMDNRTTLFIWNYNISPMAVSVDYLFEETVGRRYNIIPNKPSESFPSLVTDTYKYNDTINTLKQEYGLKNEYYKNMNGEWIDIELIRNNIRMFDHTLIKATITKFDESVIYVYADNVDILGDTFKQMVTVNINNIPKTEFIDSNGVVHYIHFSDGFYNNVENGNVFKCNTVSNFMPLELLTPGFKTPKFKIEFYNYNSPDIIPTGTPESNNYHLFDDIKITFTDNEGNPLCDCVPDPDTGIMPECDCQKFNKDILLNINGMFFDYIPEPTNNNVIYVLDVIKFAYIQYTGIKESAIPTLTTYINYDNVNGVDIHDIDVPTNMKLLEYMFNITIYKWDNISISNFVQPINTYKELKNEASSNEMYYLTTKLIFSEAVDINKCLLIKNSELVSKQDYKIDQFENNIIELKYVSKEFDILMGEIRGLLDEYVFNEIHDLVPPKPLEYDTFEEYLTALEEFITINGFDVHGVRSALTIVKQQFDDLRYSLLRVESTDTLNDLYIYENDIDVITDSPYRGSITIENWNMNDLLVFNGFSRRVEQLFDKTFKLPNRAYYNGNYSDSNVEIFNNSNVYKLEMLKDHK